MAYKINNTFGTLLVTLADGTIDTVTTDLSLFGKGYAGFGEKLNENLVALQIQLLLQKLAILEY